ncbi:hypothetical protein Tco_0801777 [Tanacetum coccineum]|uniref:Retrotransposon gag domain-containing protein n=1 Tax=Tanacetum coccineum TaxID=301880 RepID=A0ABQ4ZWZ1_9ASTR
MVASDDLRDALSVIYLTYAHSSIPSEDPYEEAARQLLEHVPRSPEYVPDPIELEDHVHVYISEPDHPEDLVPAEDEEPTPPLPPSFLSLCIRTPRTRAAMAQTRAITPSTYHLLLPSGTPPLLPIPLPAPFTSRRADIPEADTPPQKRLLLTTPRPSCEVGESSVAAAARQPGPTMAYKVDYSLVDVRSRESSEFYSRHHDAQKDRAAVRAEIERLRCMPEWQRQAADDLAVQHIMRTLTWRLGARVGNIGGTGRVPRPLVMIDQGQHKSARDAYSKFLNANLWTSKALRELSDSLDGLRKWSLCLALAIAQHLVKSNLRLALYKTMLLHGGMPSKGPHPEAAHAMPWATLKKMMTDKYCPRGEIKKIETEMWNLKDVPEEKTRLKKYIGGFTRYLHGSVKASKPKTMQEAIEFTTELMDEKTHAYAERQAERKRKYDDLSKNNQNQQQQNKRQNTGQAYTAGNSDRKSYAGSKPLCSKCNYNHEGPCPPRAPAKVYVVGNAGANPDISS